MTGESLTTSSGRAMIDELLESSAVDATALLGDQARMERVAADYMPLMKGYPAVVADLMEALLRESERGEHDDDVKAFVDAVARGVGTELIEPHGPQRPNAHRTAAAVRAKWPSLRERHLAGIRTLSQTVADGDGNAVRAGLENLRATWRECHDALAAAMEALLEFTQERYGAEGLDRVLRAAAEPMRPVLERWAALPRAELAEVVQRLLVAHGSTFTRSDTRQATVFHLAVCASGGRILRSRVDGGRCLGRLAERTSWAPYCAHCRVWNESLPSTWWGRPLFRVEPDGLTPESCTLVLEAGR